MLQPAAVNFVQRALRPMDIEFQTLMTDAVPFDVENPKITTIHAQVTLRRIAEVAEFLKGFPSPANGKPVL